MPQVSGTTLWNLLGWTLLAAGILLALWSLFWDRSRGRLRCPRCWYRVEGVPVSFTKFHRAECETMKCSECGKVIAEERMLRKIKRRWWLAISSIVFVLVTPQAWEQPSRIENAETWTRCIPTWFACMFLASPDEQMRHDAQELLSVRRARCNIFERYWMDKWRDRGVVAKTKSMIEHRHRVVAGQKFRIWLKQDDTPSGLQPLALTSSPSTARKLPAVFSTPGTILPILAMPHIYWRPLKQADDEEAWDADFGLNRNFAEVTAPRSPGKRTMMISFCAIASSDVNDPIEYEVAVHLEVCADLPDVLEAQKDAELERWLREKTVVFLNGSEELVVRCHASESTSARTVTCELLRNGTVVGTSRKPMMPYQNRAAAIQIPPDIAKTITTQKAFAQNLDEWQLRLRGTYEDAHEYTLEDTYWSGEVVLPFNDVFK